MTNIEALDKLGADSYDIHFQDADSWGPDAWIMNSWTIRLFDDFKMYEGYSKISLEDAASKIMEAINVKEAR